jgi:hypothetical protein
MISDTRMSSLFSCPTEIHVEILVSLVVDCFNTVVDDHDLVNEFEDTLTLFATLFTGDRDGENNPVDKIAGIALVFATIGTRTVPRRLPHAATARLCWRSHRRFILHRAAAECLKDLEPCVKATRRVMVRRRFQFMVWQAVTPNDFTRLQLAEGYFIGSAINFWDFDYKSSALRVILKPIAQTLELASNYMTSRMQLSNFNGI